MLSRQRPSGKGSIAFVVPVDRILVTRKMALILEDMPRLEALGRLSLDEFLSDSTHQLVAERLLERVISRMIDINYHLITEGTGMPPRDFYDSFLRLSDIGVMSPQVARAMAPASGLRNRLAHEYNEIDPVKIQEAVRTAVTQVPQYLEAVQRFLDAR